MKQLIVFDETKPNHLLEYLISNNINSVFLVRGKDSFFQSGSSDYIKTACQNIKIHHFFGFNTNPKIEDVIKGLHAFNKSKAQVIIAIGGGSVIDMAKLVRIKHSSEYSVTEHLTSNSLFSSKVNLIAIPTTAGTGSESTHFSVMYIGKKKYSISSESMLANIVILKPKLTYSSLPRLTAISGLDALSQAIESLWSTNSTNTSIIYSKSAIKRIMKYLPIAIKEMDNKEARTNLLLAANESGKAINITKTTAPHAISYPFTSYFNIPHGQAVAITLPFFLSYNYMVTREDCNDSRGFKYVQNSILEIARLLGSENVKIAESILRDFIYKVGIEIDIIKLGINKEQFNSIIIPNINIERLSNNPRKLSKDWYKSLL